VRRSDGSTRRDDEILTSGSKKRMNGKLSTFITLKRSWTTLDEYDVTKSQVEASIEVGSIKTRNPDRDAHLKSADFCDVQTFPILSFSSTRVSPKGEGKLDLRRKSNHSRSAPPGRVRARRAGCTGHRSVGQHADRHVSDHKDQPEGLRVSWKTALETGGFLVGDEVAITLEVQAVKG
jgi:YceI-like protein